MMVIFQTSFTLGISGSHHSTKSYPSGLFCGFQEGVPGTTPLHSQDTKRLRDIRSAWVEMFSLLFKDMATLEQ